MIRAPDAVCTCAARCMYAARPHLRADMHVHHALRGRRGFTLVEIVVVLLIMVVATAVTVPALLPPRDPDELTLATQRIDALFRLARDSAARSGTRVLVTIDSATGGAWLLAGTDIPALSASAGGAAASAGGAAASALDAATGASLDLPPSVRLHLLSARARFEFAPGGPAFGDTLVLRSSAATRLITLDPWTGDVVVN